MGAGTSLIVILCTLVILCALITYMQRFRTTCMYAAYHEQMSHPLSQATLTSLICPVCSSLRVAPCTEILVGGTHTANEVLASVGPIPKGAKLSCLECGHAFQAPSDPITV
jgi:transcription elongation factor Elf1